MSTRSSWVQQRSGAGRIAEAFRSNTGETATSGFYRRGNTPLHTNFVHTVFVLHGETTRYGRTAAETTIDGGASAMYKSQRGRRHCSNQTCGRARKETAHPKSTSLTPTTRCLVHVFRHIHRSRARPKSRTTKSTPHPGRYRPQTIHSIIPYVRKQPHHPAATY